MSPNAPAALDGFGEFVRETLDAWKVPGMAVAAVRGGEAMFLEGFGQRDRESGLPVTPRTRFALASGTKAFTTMALGMLVDDGRLDWDRPVREYLPSFRLHDLFASERLTPRDLVTHRAGLPRHDLAWYNAPFDRADLVRRLRFLEPNKDLRAIWQYQNLMYMTAGYLIEHLTGQTWEMFVRERIFAPLGMDGSNVSVEDSQASDDFAVPYKEKDEVIARVPFYRQFAVGPAGSINTCAADMAQWLRLHLGRGVFNGRRLISEAQLRDMHTPQMVVQRPARWAELPHQSYALGWFVEPYRGYDLLHHGGNIDGFSTMTTLMPREGLGVVALANLDSSPAPWIVCLGAYDRLLGLEPLPWTARHKEEVAEYKAAEAKGRETGEAQRVADAPPSHPLEAYAGEYEHPGYGVLTFELRDGALAARLNDVAFATRHYHYDTFELALEQWDVRLLATFAANARGDIETVSAPFEPTVRDIVFARRPDRALRDPAALRRFTGEYEVLGRPLSILLIGDTTLVARLPGQPEVELVPRRGAEFLVKGISGFSVEFVEQDGAVVEVRITQAGSTFTAKRRPG